MRRALVTLPEGVWRVVDDLKGTLGDGDSEVIRNLVIAHLTERGILLPSRPSRATVDPVRSKQKELENKVSDLVRVLEESGILRRGSIERTSKNL